MASSAILKVDVLFDSIKAVSGFKSIGDAATKQAGTVQTFGTKATGAFNGVTKSLASTALAGVGVGAALGVIGAAIGKSIADASKLQQATGAVEQVFEDSAGQVEDFAKAAADSMGLAESDYKNMAAVMGASMKNAGVPVDQLADKTNALMQRAADLSATFGGPVEDAMGAFQSALRGEFDPIERFGVGLTAASIEARAMEMGLIDANEEMDRTAKVAAITEEILSQTADSAGMFAEEADTLAGATARLNAKMENFSAGAGGKLLPFIEGAIDGLENFITAVSFMDAEMSGAAKGNELFVIGIEGIAAQTDITTTAVQKLAGGLVIAADKGVAPTTEAFMEQADQMKLNLGDTRRLARQIGELASEGEITRESAYELMGMLNQQAEAMETTREDGRLLSDRYINLRDDAEEARVKAAGYRRELSLQADEMRKLTDPIFALRTAQRQYNDAFNRWSELAVSGQGTADELAEAEDDLTIASLELRDAELAAETGGKRMEDAWDAARAEAGLLEDATWGSKEAIDQWSEAVNRAPRFHPGTGSGAGEVPMAAGGIVTRPTHALIGEAGPEAVIPLRRAGGARGIGGMGSSYTLNLNVRRADANDIAWGFKRLELLRG